MSQTFTASNMLFLCKIVHHLKLWTRVDLFSNTDLFGVPALEKEYRRKEASNLSGITSTSVILKNLESKVGNLKSEIAITNEVRKNPCDPPKAAATDAIKSNTTSIDESSIENEVVEENGAPTRYNAV